MQKSIISYVLFCAVHTILFSQSIQIITYYSGDSSRIKEIIYINPADSVLNGPFKSFYENGSPQTVGFYLQNEPDSIWTYFYENGKSRARGRLSGGQQSGHWEYFYESGLLKAEGELNPSGKTGIWNYYFENGNSKSSGSYLSDKKNGIWNYFYEDGTVKAQAVYESGIGEYREFYPSGSTRMEGTNAQDKSTGLWKFYYESGELQGEGIYEMGQREGRWVFYHKNGNKMSEGNYRKGMREGNWTYYHENGNVSSQGNITDNQKDGQWNLYYANGELMGQGDYNKGTGVSIEYYPSGTILAKGPIVDGKRNGKWEFFDENGDKNGEAVYEGGQGEFKGLYPDGSTRMTGTLEGTKKTGQWSLFDKQGNLVGTYRPIYEENTPVFRMGEDFEDTFIPYQADKPEYKYKSKSNRYFDARINEFTGIIISSNPFRTIFNELPLSLEFYFQERLGYELQYFFLRKSFFANRDNLPLEELYSTGHRLNFRQKFYSKDSKYGMIYFGHQLSFKQKDHQVNYLNESTLPFEEVQHTSTETTAAYGLFVGWKWIKDITTNGITFDGYFGVDLGYRNWERKYVQSIEIDQLFNPINQSPLYLPFNVGIQIGWITSTQKLLKN
jgi:antitoxin component YwqK of YwqJK toxin-antitoxin module